MALKLTTFKTARVRVAGSVSDEDGKPVPFSFTLKCTRIDQSELDALRGDHNKSVDKFMTEVTQDWEGVLDADGAPMQFNPENFAAVMDQPGMPAVCFGAFVKEISVAAKA